MSRKSFVLYTEWENTFNRLSNELAGELIKVIFDYVRTGEIPQIDNAVVDGVFSAFQPSIDRNISKYDAAIEQRKEAGKRSAEKRKRDATTVESRLRTSTVSDSVSDTLSLNGESVREGANKVFDLQSIKEQLLSDELWKESVCMQSTLGVSFISMLPAQLDKFIAYIVSIGEERSISNISDAKRRFTYWWQNHGRKEVQDENKQVYTVPN
ncbi:DUF6291 domain-containing protein [Bacteroides finegoldii]|jgi:hypothetical protein|nr:DUF6291 domain-containing protein [Bacteroides finegoldii]MCG4684336.1 DUF6291 domain-containing protein [Bacteroides finegoldii]CDC52005.1 predicted protein [Bacteroides finegoldii CAG:203]DAQ44739.1 MAG TPA: hypothetical protein [Caudoviricetes sp.]